jgi:hypothetical protein
MAISWGENGTERAIMRLLSLISAAFAMLLAGPSLAQGWIEYVVPEEMFSVNFPGEPEVREITYTAKSGASLLARSYTIDDGPNRYSATVIHYMDAAKEDLDAAIAHAAENLRKTASHATYDARASISGTEGHMLQLTNADQGRTYALIILEKARLYITAATVPEGSISPGHFQQSLLILDEKGRQVRYGTDVDGNKFRTIPGSGGQPLLE